MTKKKPYDERSDREKIESQWTKLSGLQDRTEWSAAIIRAATAAEIAVNLALRCELKKSGLEDRDTVDIILRSANGLQGKFVRLLKPLARNSDYSKQLNQLWRKADEINKSRNEIAHSGAFRSESEAKKIINRCRDFVLPLVKIYEPDFELKAPFENGSMLRKPRTKN